MKKAKMPGRLSACFFTLQSDHGGIKFLNVYCKF